MTEFTILGLVHAAKGAASTFAWQKTFGRAQSFSKTRNNSLFHRFFAFALQKISGSKA
jgi:hypothetical protein